MKPSGSSSSSEEEDGDARWKARILSAAAAGEFSGTSGPTRPVRPQGSYLGAGELAVHDEPQPNKEQSRGLKLYQIKARKLLDDMLDNSLMIVQDLNAGSNSNAQVEDCGVRLFRKAPHGIIFDRLDVYPRPAKRPQIIPREEIDEKSKKFRRQIRHAAVEGVDVMASAEDAMQRSSTRFEARDAAAKAAAKREEERIAELKKFRGEKWLPALARQMQVDIGRRR